MNRCIYAEDIKNAIEGVTRSYLSAPDTIDSVTAKWLYKRLRTLVDEMPTADVVERKIGKGISGKCVSGKWIDQYQNGDWHCSCCGAIVEKEEQMLHNWYFCYHCGARMDERREDD